MASSIPPNAEDPVEQVDTGRPRRPDPRFSIVHESEVPWTEVVAQQHGDRRVSVHEKFLEWCPDRMVVLGFLAGLVPAAKAYRTALHDGLTARV